MKSLETWFVCTNTIDSFKQYLLLFLQIDLQHFVNPEETCHYLLIIAGMFGLVNQVNWKEIEGCFWGLSHGTVTDASCVRFFLLMSSKRTTITVVCWKSSAHLKNQNMFSMKRLYKYKLISRLNNFLKLVAEGERNHINIWKSCIIYFSDLQHPLGN